MSIAIFSFYVHHHLMWIASQTMVLLCQRRHNQKMWTMPKGLFTVRNVICNCDIANKWYHGYLLWSCSHSPARAKETIANAHVQCERSLRLVLYRSDTWSRYLHVILHCNTVYQRIKHAHLRSRWMLARRMWAVPPSAMFDSNTQHYSRTSQQERQDLEPSNSCLWKMSNVEKRELDSEVLHACWLKQGSECTMLVKGNCVKTSKTP